MFLHAFTEQSFKDALTLYLRNKQYSYATEDDLFASIDAIVKRDGTLPANFNTSEIMKSWTRQSGYPILKVTRNYKDNTLEIHQERYFSEPQSVKTNQTWWVPYNLVVGGPNAFYNDTRAQYWLPQNTNSVVLTSDDSLKWTSKDAILLNAQQTGYYRVLYDEQNYNLIANDLHANGDRIPPTTKSQLIDDLFEFANHDLIGYESVLNLLTFLSHERNYVPWASANNGLNQINRILSGGEAYPSFLVSF